MLLKGSKSSTLISHFVIESVFRCNFHFLVKKQKQIAKDG